jgi:hypothetical protein
MLNCRFGTSTTSTKSEAFGLCEAEVMQLMLFHHISSLILRMDHNHLTLQPCVSSVPTCKVGLDSEPQHEHNQFKHEDILGINSHSGKIGVPAQRSDL